MGFTVNNSFGKFQAETHLPLPTFSAESLMPLSSKQFGAATIDAANITNYDDAVFSRFNVGDGGTGGGAGTVNKNGGIVTAYDKGFHFTLDPAAAVESQVVNLSQTGSKTFSFTLKPGDQLYRDGRNRSVIYEPADGDKVTTEVPWIRSKQHTITLDAATAVADDPISGCTSVTATNYNSTATIDDGSCIEPAGDEGDEDEDSPNYLLYGGGLALLVVGGIMASKMMKK